MDTNPEFFELISKAAARLKKWIKQGELIRITSHIDADGITAGGIMATALYREKARFHLRIVRQLEDQFVKELASENHGFHVLCDLGSGHLSFIKEYMPKEEIIILDHHPPQEKAPSNCIHVSPHLHGIDGARDVSAAGICYFVVKALNKENENLAHIAIVGAVGDRQNKGKKGGFLGLNQQILHDGMKLGIIQERKDLRLPGRENLPLHLVLKESIEPYFPGLTGNEENCLRFIISEMNLQLKEGGRYRTLSELSVDEKRTFTTKLVEYGLNKGLDSSIMQALVGFVYLFPKEKEGTLLRNSAEFAYLLNSCGRKGRAGAGIAICMGERGNHYQEAVKEYNEYRQALREDLQWLEQTDAILQKDHVQYFFGKGRIHENLAGEVTSLLVSSSLIMPSKPIFGFSESDEEFKFSARARSDLVGKGLNLGRAIRTALAQLKLKTGGGGHDVAAGGRIPKDSLMDFLNEIDEIIENQLTKGAKGESG